MLLEKPLVAQLGQEILRLSENPRVQWKVAQSNFSPLLNSFLPIYLIHCHISALDSKHIVW